VTRRIVVAGAWLATLAGAAALSLVERASGGIVFGSGFEMVFAGLAMNVVAFSSVGAILTLRRPGNRIGLVLMVAAMLLAVTFLGFIYGAVLTAARGRDDALAGFTALLGGLGIYPTLVVAGPIVALLLPDGHLPGPRWRWPVRVIAIVIVIGEASFLVQPGPIGDSLANNPLGVADVGWLASLSGLGGSLAGFALPVSLFLALAGVVVRFRRSGDVEREQLKWFAAAYAVVVVFLLLSFSDGATQPTVFDVVSVWSLSLLPIAIGIAVLRYRLYEIDRIISRTLTYGVLTVVLVCVYVAGLTVLQAVLAPVTSGGGPIAVAASTLAAFALFQPLRRRLQAAMDRRFNRSRYDAQRTIDSFSAQLRDEVDLERLGGELRTVVGRSLAPTSIGVWLRRSQRTAGR
jgi:MFS family permease